MASPKGAKKTHPLFSKKTKSGLPVWAASLLAISFIALVFIPLLLYVQGSFLYSSYSSGNVIVNDDTKDVKLEEAAVVPNLPKLVSKLKIEPTIVTKLSKYVDNEKHFYCNMTIKSEVGVETLVLKVRRDWAPLGAER